MKIISALVFSLLFPVLIWAQEKKHVILISIDGLRPEFYQDGGYSVPNLKKLMNEGVYAKHMKSVFPSYTYPSHVAILTGALPARSGIYYNSPIGSAGEWHWFTREIKVPTLWQAMKKTGMTSSAIEWPVSVDENITWNIPEIWNVKNTSDRITEVRKYATKGLVEEVEKAIGKLDSVNMGEENLSLDANSAKIAAYIFKTYQPNFMALHFACVDGRQHTHGRTNEAVKEAMVNADKAIGTVLQAIESSGRRETTTILVVGDHGMADINMVIRPNLWLKNYKTRFVASGGSAFLYGADTVEFKTIKALLDTVSLKMRFRVIERVALDKMGADSAAVLALSAVPGTVFSNAEKGSLIAPVKGGHHGYDPNLPEMYTGFIAAGAGINKGKVIEELCVTDIAPLIAELLGLDFKAPDGKLVPGILKNNNKK